MSTANNIEDLHNIINHFVEEMLLCEISRFLDFKTTISGFLDHWRMFPAFWVYILQLFILQEHVRKVVNAILEDIILLPEVLEPSYQHRKLSQPLFKLGIYHRRSYIVYV